MAQDRKAAERYMEEWQAPDMDNPVVARIITGCGPDMSIITKGKRGKAIGS